MTSGERGPSQRHESPGSDTAASTPGADAAGARDAALLLMAKMAAVDGAIADEERESLAEMSQACGVDRAVDATLAAAAEASVEDLCARLDRYEDRFFVALRAYMLARSDTDFSSDERALYRDLVDRLGISELDQALIRRVESAARAITPRPVPRRVEELYARSSFAPQDR